MRWGKFSFSILLALGLSACASTGGWRTGAPEVEQCVSQYAAIDKTVKRAGVRDAEYARIDGFPYFRIDRFLASYDFKAFNADERTAWIDRLVDRALDGQQVEIGNLPIHERTALQAQLGTPSSEVVKRCAKTLRAYDHAQKAAHKALPPNAQVPDNYSSGWRSAGLYPLSALAVNLGFSRWKAGNLDVFETPPSELPVKGRIATYRPEDAFVLSPAEITRLVDGSRTNALGIPEPTGKARDQLIAAFAPVWQVDATSTDDLIGTPRWKDGIVEINPGTPVTYTRFSHVRWQGHILLQINYMIWFPARTVQGSFDFLGGHVDGVTWRVTIGPDGRPLLYDAMHNCGCYHLFFPSKSLRLKPAVEGGLYYEGTVVAGPAPDLEQGGRIAIRLASVSHYLQHVGAWDGTEDATYPFADYRTLRRLPRDGGETRSMFGPSGIVPGTSRKERYWLWAMGIEDPGAMRQWGNHATAFVGRRHFDDPWLIEKNFERLNQPASP